MSTAPQLISSTPHTLAGLASPSSAATSSSLHSLSLLSSLTVPARLATYPLTFLMRGLGFAKTGTASAVATPAAVTAATSALGGWAGSGPTAIGSATTALGGSGSTVAASLGRAAAIGPLSVPQLWTGPTTSPAAAALPGAGVGMPGTSGLSGMPLMPITQMAGRSAGGATPHYDLRPTVIPRSPSAG